jgi:hypothetical protein
MKLKSLTTALIVTTVLVGITSIAVLWEHSETQRLREEQTRLSNQVKEIDLLKTRWSLQSSRSDLDTLKNHPNLLKQEKRGGNLYLEYDNLSSTEFNAVSNKLLNSMLVIKKLTLRRNGTAKGSIIVEIES